MGVRWTTEENRRLAELWPIASKQEIREAFPSRTYKAIGRVASLLGLSCTVERNQRGTVAPLLEDTLTAFYWIGFICADGHITKQNQLIVCLANQDRNHLQKLADLLKTKIYQMPGKLLLRIAVADKKLIPVLRAKFDIHHNKTISPPSIKILEEEKLLAFIAGFLDGDGDISKQHKRQDVRIRVMCHASWLENLQILERSIYAILGYEQTTNVRLNARGYANLGIYNRHVIYSLKSKFVLLGLPLLERKWGKVLSPYQLLTKEFQND